MKNDNVSRRTLMKGAGATAALAGAPALLAGCGENGAKSQKEAVEANRRLKLPTYKEYGGIEPDLQGTPGGIRPAFFHYPKEHRKTVEGTPGKGGKFSAMMNIYFAIPPGPDRNKYLQGLNKRLGATFDLKLVPNADYETKFPTVVAGDVPDFLQMGVPGSAVIPNYAQLLDAKFADLTEFLSGDAILKYPNLANIHTRSWKSCVFNGKIMGIPVPRDAVGGMPFVRADIFKKLKLSLEPENFEEFEETLKALTSPREKRWVFANHTHPRDIVMAMLKVRGNEWVWDGKKVREARETDEYRRALTIVRGWWKKGYIHPDAFAANVPPFKQWFNAGTTVVAYDGYQAWSQYILDNSDNKEFELGLLTVPGYDGGVGRISLGRSYFTMTAFKKAPKKRLQEQLAIANWLAAPFGSEEFLFRWYGEEGVHHTMSKDGDPTYTPVGISETAGVPVRYITEGPQVIYQAGRPDDAKIQHEYESRVVPKGIPNPCLGLYSSTQQSKGRTIEKRLGDFEKELIRGLRTMKEWDEEVDRWRKGGGDEIKKEFTEQIQEVGPNKQ